jgi:hypothetical protein
LWADTQCPRELFAPSFQVFGTLATALPLKAKVVHSNWASMRRHAIDE